MSTKYVMRYVSAHVEHIPVNVVTIRLGRLFLSMAFDISVNVAVPATPLSVAYVCLYMVNGGGRHTRV